MDLRRTVIEEIISTKLFDVSVKTGSLVRRYGGSVGKCCRRWGYIVLSREITVGVVGSLRDR